VWVNIWSAEPIPMAVGELFPHMTVTASVLSGELAARTELTTVLDRLREHHVPIVSVEIAP
jgi:hypothetical protein